MAYSYVGQRGEVEPELVHFLPQTPVLGNRIGPVGMLVR